MAEKKRSNLVCRYGSVREDAERYTVSTLYKQVTEHATTKYLQIMAYEYIFNLNASENDNLIK